MVTRFSLSNKGIGPHAGQAVLAAGPEVGKARGVMVLVHGRGASAEDMLGWHEELGVEGVAAVVPEAAGNTWYPQSFLAPLEANQPWLDSALGFLELAVAEVLARGVASRRVGLLGFSQGACLTLEYVARHPRRYGAVVGLTGGLIGPPETARRYAGSLEGTPVFLGSGDPDPHVPFARVQETRDVLEKMGGVVELRRFPGMPHGINEEEMTVARGMVERMAAGGAVE